VAADSFPVCCPITVATITNVSDVACRKPPATARRRPTARVYSSAGTPREISSASRNSGTSASAPGCFSSPLSWNEIPVATKKTGIRKPNPIPSSLIRNSLFGSPRELSTIRTTSPAANEPRIDANPNR